MTNSLIEKQFENELNLSILNLNKEYYNGIIDDLDDVRYKGTIIISRELKEYIL